MEAKQADRPAADSKAVKQGALWKDRIKHCHGKRDRLLREGKRVEQYVNGGSPELDKLEEKGELDGMVRVLLPKTKVLVDTIAPAITDNDPAVQPVVRKAGHGREFAEKRRALVVALLNKTMEEQKVRNVFRRATREALVYNLSAIEVDYDTKRGLPRAVWRSIKTLLWDTGCDGDERTLRWLGYEFTMDVHTARDIYKAPWLQANATSMEPAHVQINSKDGIAGTRKDSVKLIRIYVRGDDPLTEDGDIASPDNKAKDRNPNDEYPGENKCIVLDAETWTVVHTEKWGFTLDHDAFPIIPLRVEPDHDTFEGQPPLAPFLPLQRAQEMTATALATQTFIGSRIIGWYDPEEIQGPEQAALTKTGRNLWLPLANYNPNNPPLGRIDLGNLQNASKEGFAYLGQMWEQVTQSQDLSTQVLEGVSKTGVANAIQERSANRISVMAKQVEGLATSTLQSMLQISLSVMTAKDVVRWVGVEMVGEIRVDQTPPPADPIALSMGTAPPSAPLQIEIVQYWPEDLTPEDIRAELVIRLEAGSMTRGRKQEKIDNNNKHFEFMMATLPTVASMAAEQGLELDIHEYVRVVNEHIARQAELQGDDAERYMITPEMLRPIQTPVIDPNSGMPAAGATPNQQMQVASAGVPAGIPQ